MPFLAPGVGVAMCWMGSQTSGGAQRNSTTQARTAVMLPRRPYHRTRFHARDRDEGAAVAVAVAAAAAAAGTRAAEGAPLLVR